MIRRPCPECREPVNVIGGIIVDHQRPGDLRTCEGSWSYVRVDSQPKPQLKPELEQVQT